MYLYNLCHNYIDCTELVNQIYYRIPSTSTRIREKYPHQLFAAGPCRTNSGKRAPLHRMVQVYNKSLSNIDIFVTSRMNFKKLAIEAFTGAQT